MCVFARQITPPVSQHARLPLGDWKVTIGANLERTSTTGEAPAPLGAGVVKGGVVVGPVVTGPAPADRDGDGAPAMTGVPPPLQAATRQTLISRDAGRTRRRPARVARRNPEDVRTGGPDKVKDLRSPWGGQLICGST